MENEVSVDGTTVINLEKDKEASNEDHILQTNAALINSVVSEA